MLTLLAVLDPGRFWSLVLALSLFGALSVSFSASEFTLNFSFPKVSFISVNEWSIEELSVVIEDTSCLVISESASIIESGFPSEFGDSPCLPESSADISSGFCLFVMLTVFDKVAEKSFSCFSLIL